MIHHIIREAYRFEAQRFDRALGTPEITQRETLRKIIEALATTPYGQRNDLGAHARYETYAEKFPLTDYEFWRPLIDNQRRTKTPELNVHISRYEPTSGSTGERKWIPYTPDFLAEINRAAQAWIHDMYRAFPAMARGRHFWSLSWIPLELRGIVNTNDAELFPFWQRLILKQMMAFHPAIQTAKSAEAAWWATKLFLASCADLRFISVWSPTFVLNLIRELFAERELVARALRTSRFTHYEAELAGYACPSRSEFPSHARTEADFVRQVWPALALVSTWDSASSKTFIPALRDALGDVPIQGKGLWSTEGVVTIPWKNFFPLAVRSHFYEFRCLSTNRILPSWQLEQGQDVQPILTTGGGLLRYTLPDHLRVTGFAKETPSLEFQGRLGGVDLVGEKLSFTKAQEIVATLQTLTDRDFPGVKIYCLGAQPEGTQAKYSALCVGPDKNATAIAAALENELVRIHHYALARELHQMKPAGAIMSASLEALSPLLEKNKIKGQNKPESIVLLS